jgi:3' terminal RNA ribose 2'-O-methyltransferase Hen1
VLPCRGGEQLLRRLFEPLGYDVRAERLDLDVAFPAWGESDYLRVELRGQVRLSDLLTHLYVLVPVLDDDKHYWVGDAEVEKLLRRGEGWLGTHPARELIAARYLRRQRPLISEALSRLDAAEPEPLSDAHGDPELPERVSLHQQRLGTAVAALKSLEARRIVDLGCGEGRLLELLLHDPQFTELAGVDVSYRALEIASRRLRLETMLARKERVRLLQGALTYRDRRIAGFDAATLLEVIEHIEPARLPAVERVVFEFARPGAVVLTTPNREYNAVYPPLPAGRLRHRDHRFEWTRAEFEAWVHGVCERNGYRAEISGIGPVDAEHGAPTQLAVFRRA